MSIRSIYHKACPACAAPISIGNERCHCGYSFAMATDADAISEEHQQLIQDEELLESYLGARLNQAVVQLQNMHSLLIADPKNLDKATSVLQTLGDVREIREQLQQQSARVAEAKRVARGTAESADEKPASESIAADAPHAAASPEPTDAFRAAQAQKAALVMQAAGMNTKDCPKCKAVLPERAALCFCGNVFAQANTAAHDTAEDASENPSQIGIDSAPLR
jgi:hypothetical protein